MVLHNDMIHDCLVLRTHDRRAQARLFYKKDYDLRTALEAL